MEKEEVGKITHFFDKISVAVVELSAPLKVGDRISIGSHGNEVEQEVDSMQIEHEPVEKAEGGQSVGMKTSGSVNVGDKVHKIN